MANSSQKKRSLDWKERMLESRSEQRKLPRGAWVALRWIGLAAIWLFLVVLGRYSTHHPFSSFAPLYILATATAGAMVVARWLPPPR